MPQTEINSFFTNLGMPATGITAGFPIVRIWEVMGATSTLIVGATCGTGQNTDGLMIELDDCGGTEQDGFYTFLFDAAAGYVETRNYLVRTDGGPTLTDADRYQSTTIVPSVLDVPLVPDHILPGSLGELQTMIKADTTAISLTTIDTNALANLILQYDIGRTRIDETAMTLTVFAADCVTPLRVFNLLDGAGNPSVTDVCERRPVSASDGAPVCP